MMGTRRYQTDYAGFWRGHCKTRESAIVAATRRIVQDGGTRATITDLETGKDIVRITLADNRKSVVITTVTQIKRIGK